MTDEMKQPLFCPSTFNLDIVPPKDRINVLRVINRVRDITNPKNPYYGRGINTREWREIIPEKKGRSYRTIVDLCRQNQPDKGIGGRLGIIKQYGDFLRGDHPYSYRIADEYWADEWEFVCYDTGRHTRKMPTVKLKIYGKRVQYADLSDVNKYIHDSIIRMSYTDIPADKWADLTKESKNALTEISHKRYYLTQDKYGRRHTSFAQIPKIIREFVRIEHNGVFYRLVNIDLSSSQPLFLGLLAKKYVNDREFVEFYREKAKDNPRQPHNSNSTWGDSINRWIDHCCRGTLYNFLSIEAGLGPLDDDDDKKAHFKGKVFFPVIYGGSTTKKRTEERRLLAETIQRLFPGLWAFMQWWKRPGQKYGYRSAKDKKGKPVKSESGRIKKYWADISYLLAREMQRVEARFMVDSVCGRITKEMDIPILPLHDALEVPDGYENAVLSILADEFMRQYNISPTIKAKAV
jgi:hypothetical protein